LLANARGFHYGRGGGVGRGLGVNAGLGVGAGLGVKVAVAVGVDVGVGLGAAAQYLPPVLESPVPGTYPPHTIISLPVHIAV